MPQISRVNEDIFRIVLPYKDIFTTVYAVTTPEGVLLYDAGSFEEDAREHILPALEQLGIEAAQVRYILISHNHIDHAGGLSALWGALPHAQVLAGAPELTERCPQVVPEILKDGQTVLGVLQAVAIPGHTADSMGLFDRRSATLLTGDALQGYGICGGGEWAANIRRPGDYVRSIERLRGLPVEQLLTAHHYEPFGYRAQGAQAVAEYLEECFVPLRRLQRLIKAQPEKSDEELAAIYSSGLCQLHLAPRIVGFMRRAMEEGEVPLL